MRSDRRPAGPLPVGDRHLRSRLRTPLIVMCGAVLLAACGTSATASRAPARPTGARAQSAAASEPTAPPGSTLLVTLHNDVPSYLTPGGPASGTVPGSWQGAPSVLPVIAEQPGYLQVRLAQRPNESTAWIRAQGLSYSATPYRIVVDLATTHLTLFDKGRQVVTMPAGVGLPQYPTPTGQFFVALLAMPPSPGYGPFVMVTSAHSNTITDWDYSGDAIVAIHGPLGASAAIGTTGAQVSHGCVRLQLADQEQLRVVPVGTPVDIVSA